MNKKLLIIALILLAALTAGTALAADGVKIDSANFPDANFRKYVKAEFDTDKNGTLSQKEIDKADVINVNGKGIKNLTGIALFPGLKALYCSQNALTKLDVSKNANLEELYCFENKLKSIDLSANTALIHFSCDGNPITKLDLSANTALKSLSCNNTSLTALNLSKNTALTALSCAHAKLKSLNIKANKKLSVVYCNNNQLALLTMNNAKLEQLYCEYNDLTSLDLNGSPKLKILYCQSNHLTSLSVAKNPALRILSCHSNALTALDISACSSLGALYCQDNKLTALSLSTNTKLEVLNCANNQLTSLDASKCGLLSDLICTGNRRAVTTKTGKIPYTDLPGFKASKASNVEGAVKTKTAFKVTKSGIVTYEYLVRKGDKRVFILDVTLEKPEISGVTLPKTSWPYTGEPIEPKVTVTAKVNGTTVTLKSTDYTVTYKNNLNAGTASVTVTAAGDYTGTIVKKFTITPVKILKLTLSKYSLPYTGKARKPITTVTTKVNGHLVTLTKGTDYTVKYENNIEKGTATVTVTGKGNYKGTLTKTFKIE